MMEKSRLQEPHPILYSFRRCPYAMRARVALLVAGHTCEVREIELRDKPQSLINASRKATVPVLIDQDGSVIDESLDIMIWSLKKSDPEGWLSPDSGTLTSTLEFIETCDRSFKKHLDEYKYGNRECTPASVKARAEGSRFLSLLNAKLEVMPYLFGAKASLGDFAVFPFIRQFAHVDREWFRQQPWGKLQHWLDSFLNSELFGRAMKKYPKWEDGSSAITFL